MLKSIKYNILANMCSNFGVGVGVFLGLGLGVGLGLGFGLGKQVLRRQVVCKYPKNGPKANDQNSHQILLTKNIF